MTENEKLDLILAKLGKIDRLETEFGEFREKLDKIDKLETEFGEFKEKQDKLDDDVRNMKLILENEIRSNIMCVAEGHLDIKRKLWEATKSAGEMVSIAVRVNMMETDLRNIKEQLNQTA